MASEGLHEPIESLSPETVDRHRAIISLMEELEAIDWYDQRVDATNDPDLRRVLEHNRDEEKEHAAMTLEWLRRHDSELDRQLRDWLFTERPIGVHEDDAHDDDDADRGDGAASAVSAVAGPTLGIGALFGEGTL